MAVNYSTQMDAAKKGIITEHMVCVAVKEGVDSEYIRKNVSVGKIVIPANKNHKALEPEGIGLGLRTKMTL